MSFERYLKEKFEPPMKTKLAFMTALKRPVGVPPEPPLTKQAAIGIVKISHILKQAQTEEEAVQQLEAQAMTDPQVQMALDYQQAKAEREDALEQARQMNQQLFEAQAAQAAAEQQAAMAGQQTAQLDQQLQQEQMARQQAQQQMISAKDQSLQEQMNVQAQKQQMHQSAETFQQQANALAQQLKAISAQPTAPAPAAPQEAPGAQAAEAAAQGEMPPPATADAAQEQQEAANAQQEAEIQGQQAAQATEEDLAKQQAMQEQMAMQQGGMPPEAAAGGAPPEAMPKQSSDVAAMKRILAGAAMEKTGTIVPWEGGRRDPDEVSKFDRSSAYHQIMGARERAARGGAAGGAAIGGGLGALGGHLLARGGGLPGKIIAPIGAAALGAGVGGLAGAGLGGRVGEQQALRQREAVGMPKLSSAEEMGRKVDETGDRIGRAARRLGLRIRDTATSGKSRAQQAMGAGKSAWKAARKAAREEMAKESAASDVVLRKAPGLLRPILGGAGGGAAAGAGIGAVTGGSDQTATDRLRRAAIGAGIGAAGGGAAGAALGSLGRFAATGGMGIGKRLGRAQDDAIAALRAKNPDLDERSARRLVEEMSAEAPTEYGTSAWKAADEGIDIPTDTSSNIGIISATERELGREATAEGMKAAKRGGELLASAPAGAVAGFGAGAGLTGAAAGIDRIRRKRQERKEAQVLSQMAQQEKTKQGSVGPTVRGEVGAPHIKIAQDPTGAARRQAFSSLLRDVQRLRMAEREAQRLRKAEELAESALPEAEVEDVDVAQVAKQKGIPVAPMAKTSAVKCSSCGAIHKKAGMTKCSCGAMMKTAAPVPGAVFSAVGKSIGRKGAGAALGAVGGAGVGGIEALQDKKTLEGEISDKEITLRNQADIARIKAEKDPTFLNRMRAIKAETDLKTERALSESMPGRIGWRAAQGALIGGAGEGAVRTLAGPARSLGGKVIGKLKGAAPDAV